MRTARLPRSDLPIAEARVNLISHGSDEQKIGAKQQVLLGGQGRLRSRQHLVVLIFGGTTMAEQPVNPSTALYLGVFSRAEQRVLQAIFKGIAEGSGRCVATLARLARASNTSKSNHAQCDRPSRGNGPAEKDRAPL
jgi:hypothetical protein